MKQYYIRLHSENEGPFTLEQLTEKNIRRNTPIWCEGMPKWEVADHVPELKVLFQAMPPPFEQVSSPPAYLPPVDDYEGRRSSTWKKILLVAVILFIGVVIAGVTNFSDPAPESYEQKVMTIAEMEASSPLSYLSVDGSYRNNFFATKFVIEGTIKNSATVSTYKDAVLAINFYSSTKSVIKTEYHTIYDYFVPGASKPFKFKVNTVKNAVSVGIELSSAKNR